MKCRTQLKAGGLGTINHNEALRTTGDEQPSNWRQALLALQLICPFCYVDATHIERRGRRCQCTECHQDWDALAVSERRLLRSIRIQPEG